jgi:integrase
MLTAFLAQELPASNVLIAESNCAIPTLKPVGCAMNIAMLREDNIRTGFLESKQHDSLAAETGKVGLWLRAMFEVGYTYGWRHEELLALRVHQVNVAASTIGLEPGTTKNSEGREVSMTLPGHLSRRLCLTRCSSFPRIQQCRAAYV